MLEAIVEAIVNSKEWLFDRNYSIANRHKQAQGDHKEGGGEIEGCLAHAAKATGKESLQPICVRQGRMQGTRPRYPMS
jgi:hypothetical protein